MKKMKGMKEKNIKNIVDVPTYCYTAIKNLLLKITIIMIVILTAIALCGNKVQAFSLTAPENMQYIRWNTAVLGLVDAKSFVDIHSGIEGFGKNIYTSDNKEVEESQYVGTGMYCKIGNKNVTIIVKGDINGDGKVTPTDLSLYRQMAVKTIDFDYCYQKAVDMNNDNAITETDHSQLKMMLVGLPLPEEKKDPNDRTPKLDGEIEIVTSTEGATKQLTITVNWPTGTNLEECTKKISTDGGKTYKDYTGPITLDENTVVVATYFDKDGNPIASETLRLDNIDKEAPNEFEFTTEVTTSTIVITAKTEDRMKDYEGNLVENEFTGISKYLYKLDDGPWQENNTFEGLLANTEYTVYVKAVDYAGNEKEATNNGLKVKTNEILEPTLDGSKILVEYDITKSTYANVTVTFSLEEESLAENYDIQYQVNSTTGQWITGNKYVAVGNCTIYARLVDKNGQSSTNYVTANVTNIDKLPPLEFTPTIEYDSATNKTIITANTDDAPADEENMKSGLADMYYFYWLYKDGSWGTGTTMPVETNTYEMSGNWFDQTGEENPIIGVCVDVYDIAGNSRRSEVKYIGDVTISDNELGYEFNEGPGNITIQGAEKSYSNPVIPVGFRAVETEDASWGPYLPSGWNNGLVIEDKSGNQFIWVPVPCAEGTSGADAIDAVILNTREHIDNEINLKDYFDEIPSGIADEEIKTETGKYGYVYRTEIIKQVEEYQGFYIGRYEAGRKDGALAIQKGLETVNMVTYDQAKNLAEGMYQNPYVVSGLPTGVHWDLMAEWVERDYGRGDKNYRGRGNFSVSEFTFTGKYAEGPSFGSTEQRGAYKYGENVAKPAHKEMLLTTGIVEHFKMKNAYDLLGNVWEYTSERVSLTFGNMGHDARGADYYWEEIVQGLNLNYRCYVPDGDARNEGGFRLVLFLSEGDANVEGEYNKTIDGGKANYNNPIIPAGYKAVDTDAAKWGDGTKPAVDWDKGLVIEDKTGNQYVWVPVDGENVKYETWLEVYLTYEEVGSSEIPAAWSSLGGTESSSVEEFKGFYIARYETSEDENGKVQTKANQGVKTTISYNTALEKINNYENGKTSVAGIITGKQWDTALRWIANEKGEEAVATDSSTWGNYGGSLGTTGRVSAKNIYDMAGNAWEITSETYEGKIIYRGGAVTESGTSAPAGYRDAYGKDYSDSGTTYRMVLYVKNDNYTAKEVVVPEDNPSYGVGGSTEANYIIQFSPSTTGWTNSDVTVNISTSTGLGIKYKVTPTSTRKDGEWVVGNSVKITENSVIAAALIDDKGNTKSTNNLFTLYNIDKILPNEFTPTVSLEGNRVRIKHSTTDNESGIKQYYFFMDDGVTIRETTAETEVLSKVLPVGKHQIYVVAEDNAGNLRTSSKVEVDVTSSKLRDIAKVGDYVKTSVYTGKAHNLQNFVIKDQTLKIKYFDNGSDRVVYEERILYSEPTGYSPNEWQAGSTYDYMIGYDKIIFNGDTKTYRDYDKAMITGGSGTKEDPYTVNFEWFMICGIDGKMTYIPINK